MIDFNQLDIHPDVILIVLHKERTRIGFESQNVDIINVSDCAEFLPNILQGYVVLF